MWSEHHNSRPLGLLTHIDFKNSLSMEETGLFKKLFTVIAPREWNALLNWIHISFCEEGIA